MQQQEYSVPVHPSHLVNVGAGKSRPETQGEEKNAWCLKPSRSARAGCSGQPSPARWRHAATGGVEAGRRTAGGDGEGLVPHAPKLRETAPGRTGNDAVAGWRQHLLCCCVAYVVEFERSERSV
ncbi:unnamed protein product [Urochloa humidicola]